jgi:hypothetical protein
VPSVIPHKVRNGGIGGKLPNITYIFLRPCVFAVVEDCLNWPQTQLIASRQSRFENWLRKNFQVLHRDTGRAYFACDSIAQLENRCRSEVEWAVKGVGLNGEIFSHVRSHSSSASPSALSRGELVGLRSRSIDCTATCSLDVSICCAMLG